MSHFDRAAIVQVRDGMRGWLEREENPGIAVTLALYAEAFDTCLAEIDRQAARLSEQAHQIKKILDFLPPLPFAGRTSTSRHANHPTLAESNAFLVVPSSTFMNMSGLRDRLSLIAALAMVGCAACATLAWLNQDVWYLWMTLAAVALLVAVVTRDW